MKSVLNLLKMQHYDIINNQQQLHFEVKEGDEVAYLEYRFYKDDIAFMHTEVPSSMEGRGVASALAKHAFEYAKSINKKVMVYCPFVSVYLKRHPELREQLDKKYLG